jgi:glycosyltransferase involved in cell wall biosynthesis
MKLCVVSFKQCWQDADGRWLSYGGFPAQMASLRSLADSMTIVIVRSTPREGGMPLPPDARVVALRSPHGADFRRKLSVVAHLPYYLGRIGRELQSADLVHTPVPGDLPYLGLLLAAARRRRVFALYNGSWEPNSETTFMNRVTRQTMRLLARGSNLMLAVGDGSVPPSPGMHWLFATSLTAAEIAQGSPVLDRTLQDPPRLVYAGRLSPEKGVPILVAALAQLRAAGHEPMPRLTIAGGGPDRAALEALVACVGCADLVRFTGQLDRAALTAELAAADLCVHAAHSEGYCKAWLDAMSQGLPVLATEVGAARAVIGTDGARGWLVPPGSPDAVAGALRRVLSEPRDWGALRRRCRTFAAARTLEAWGEEIGGRLAERWNPGTMPGAAAWAR